ncbi:hypothetical protein AAFH68_39210 [Flavobacterium sp. CGRL1]
MYVSLKFQKIDRQRYFVGKFKNSKLRKVFNAAGFTGINKKPANLKTCRFRGENWIRNLNFKNRYFLHSVFNLNPLWIMWFMPALF